MLNNRIVESRRTGVASGASFRRPLVSRHSTFHSARRAFTLVELMVVIAIIIFLVALLGVALGVMGTQAKEAATVATIKKIHVLLEQRTEAFARAMDKAERDADNDRDYQNAGRAVDVKLAAQSVGARGVARTILIRKEFKRFNFPQSFSEVPDVNNNTTPDILEPASYVAANHTAVTESSEALYYMLTQMEVGGAPAVDAGEFLAAEVADTDSDGLMEFVDGWGNPLRFYRWPTRLFKSDGTTHTELPTVPNDHAVADTLIKGGSDILVDTDPDDPLGQLSSVISALPAHSASSLVTGSFEELYHAPYTYHLPLIVSAGVDGQLGLFEPYDTASFGKWARADGSNLDALTDNITNRNQRAGD